jgi:hypothetical protein
MRLVDKHSCNRNALISPDILIVREGDGYRLLHGHLRLANVLGSSGEVAVDVPGEGRVAIVRTPSGYVISKDGQCLPLYRD